MNDSIGQTTVTKHGVRRARAAGASLLILLAGLGAGTVQADDDHHWRGRHAYDRGFDDGYGHGYRDGRHDERHERRHWQRQYYAPQHYAPPPVVVYREAPPVYVERVIEQPVVYQQPYVAAPTYGGAYGGGYGGSYGGGNRVLSAAMLGAAGGLLGSQVGNGSGRAAATAAGAVAGWVLGTNLGR